MTGLVPAIHDFLANTYFSLSCRKDVDARHTAGHDDGDFAEYWVPDALARDSNSPSTPAA